jgi:hypothetical protein
MRRPVRPLLSLAACLALAGCGSAAAPQEHATSPPRLPRALAHAWAQQADDVASALAAGDGCRARARAAVLQRDVIAAVNAHRVPRSLLEPLSSGVNDLAGRIVCTPPPPVSTIEQEGGPKHGPGHGHGKGHEKHGHGDGDRKGGD